MIFYYPMKKIIYLVVLLFYFAGISVEAINLGVEKENNSATWLSIPEYSAIEQTAFSPKSDAKPKPLKVLAIGNSYSDDALEYLYNIAHAHGDSIVIGNMYIGGASLEMHAANSENDAATYRYTKIVGGVKTNRSSTTLLHAIKDETWDVITLQQASTFSGEYATYSPYLQTLVNYVKANATNEDMELGFHLTWAWAQEYLNRISQNKYSRNQQSMYDAIIAAVLVHTASVGINFIIPSGTAIQNGRTSILGDTFNRDGTHLNYTYGRYTAALTWYGKLFGKSVLKTSYMPVGTNSWEAEIAQYAAQAAIETPYEITSLAVSEPPSDNIIRNGSFEYDFMPSRKPGHAIYSLTDIYAEPMRVTEYFNTKTEKYWPKYNNLTIAELPVFDTEIGIWYIRNSYAYNYVRLYVDTHKNTPNGNKCLTFHNVGNTVVDKNWQASTPFQHVAAQRVSLDNTKKYTLSFSYRKLDVLQGVGTNTTSNNATRFVAGIVSSTNPSNPKDYTYVVDIPIPEIDNQGWKDTVFTLDLPALIDEKRVLDFTASAIVFGLQTKTNDSGHMLPAQISIDNIVLKEELFTNNKQIQTPRDYRVHNRKLIVGNTVHSIQVFDIAGGLVYQKRNVAAGQSVYTFNAQGVYLVKLNGKTNKILVN